MRGEGTIEGFVLRIYEVLRERAIVAVSLKHDELKWPLGAGCRQEDFAADGALHVCGVYAEESGGVLAVPGQGDESRDERDRRPAWVAHARAGSVSARTASMEAASPRAIDTFESSSEPRSTEATTLRPGRTYARAFSATPST